MERVRREVERGSESRLANIEVSSVKPPSFSTLTASLAVEFKIESMLPMEGLPSVIGTTALTRSTVLCTRRTPA